jgi:F0F1-type ATP synthase membrane subunit b/b'
VSRAGGIAFAAVLLAVCTVFAAEPHQAHAQPSLGSLFLPLLNFAIFVAVFWYFAWPVITSALMERRRVVEKELAESDRVHHEAAALLAEIEARRARVKQEGTRLVDELRAEALSERERLVRAARNSAERIGTDARLLAEQEAMRAAHAIREEVADQVIKRVVGALRERLTGEDEQRFVREFVGAVESGRVQ